MGRWTHTFHQQTDSESSHLIYDEQIFSFKKVVGCSQSECHCNSFQPGRHQIRSCHHCTHSWVMHVVSKACGQSDQVEIVQGNVVFDISSLILYGTQAVPVRMKILLDRLFSVLTHTQVLNIIHTLGWTLRDYIRGYKLQDSTGKVLDHWLIMSPEDELITLQQFLRFGETKSIVELMLQENSDICKNMQRSSSLTYQTRDSSENLSDVFQQPFNYFSPSVFPASPALSSQHHPERQELHHLKLRLDADEIGGEIKTRIRIRASEQVNGDPIKHSTHDEHLAGDVNAQVRLVEVDSSVPDSSSSSGVRERRHGSSLSKSRVSCGACAKTFYDKGTLKIHFNAVHLKIKHRCTIEGCNMTFSSLRSRNRHSANPNPRLHASQPATRPSSPRFAGRGRFRMFVTPPVPNTFRRTIPPVPMPTRTCVSLATSNADLQQNTETRCSASGGGTTGSLTANENALHDATIRMPKKKPRKSSTPLKFKRESRRDCRREDDKDDEPMHNQVTLLPRRSVNGFHSNTHHNVPISCSVSEDERHSLGRNTRKAHDSKHLHKTPYCGYYSNSREEERHQHIHSVNDGWEGRDERYLHLIQVKEEVRDLAYNYKAHHHRNL